MPTQEGVGGNEKALPMCARETSAKGSEDGPIGGPVPDTFVELTFEDSHLVPQHHDLDVFVRFGPAGRDDEPEKPADTEVEEGQGHGG
jgi:hypothetical protein